MLILNHIAQDVAENTAKILGVKISITDRNGYIIGCTDRSRLGTFHKPSLDVIKQNRVMNCEIEDSRKIENVLPGVSAPLVFNHKPIGVLGIVGEPNEVEKYVQLVKSHVEMMCQEAYRKEMQNLESKLLEMFVQQLIHFKYHEDESYVLRYANSLNFNLDLSRVCLLIQIQKTSAYQDREELYDTLSGQYVHHDLQDYLSLIFREENEDILSFINMGEFVVLKAIKTKEENELFIQSLPQKLQKLNHFLHAKSGSAASFSLGNLGFGVNGIAKSYRHAVEALSIGKKLKLEPKIYLYSDCQIVLESLPQEISQEMKGKLMNFLPQLIAHDNYNTLAETFLTYCGRSLNLSETARSLFIHRNTLIYRLEKISELTKLDTSNFEHCMLLTLAIKCHRETSLPN